MIESVDRIVSTPLRECPMLVEAIVGEDAPGLLATAHFEIYPLKDDWFRVVDPENGTSILSRGETVVMWLKPEDMNDPVVQAELIVGLAQMGIEL